MKTNLMKNWEQAQDLNFAQIREVTEAANSAASDKVREIRRSRFDEAACGGVYDGCGHVYSDADPGM